MSYRNSLSRRSADVIWVNYLGKHLEQMVRLGPFKNAMLENLPQVTLNMSLHDQQNGEIHQLKTELQHRREELAMKTSSASQ
jgi:hypothetical protein